MKILFANLKEIKSIKGHKLFDIRWVTILTSIGKVDMLCPYEDWYDTIPDGVNTIVFNPEVYLKNKKILNCKIIRNGTLARLCLYSRVVSYKYLEYVYELDRKENYDVIIFSTLDVLSFAIGFRQFKEPRKIFIIEHMLSLYEKKINTALYNSYKNKIHHIVMEKGALGEYINSYKIKENLIHYVSHPLNTIEYNKILKFKWYYDVVGISNSNSEKKIENIIRLEQERGFFKKNKVKALFRSKSITFDNDWLKVISGQVNLPFDEYYTHINMAKVIVLPFSTSFGLRTSGSIMDALSNNIQVLGSCFDTMKQYEAEYPLICHTYNSASDLIVKISNLLNIEVTDSITTEFNRFKNERSDSQLANDLKQIFKLVEE